MTVDISRTGRVSKKVRAYRGDAEKGIRVAQRELRELAAPCLAVPFGYAGHGDTPRADIGGGNPIDRLCAGLILTAWIIRPVF